MYVSPGQRAINVSSTLKAVTVSSRQTTLSQPATVSKVSHTVVSALNSRPRHTYGRSPCETVTGSVTMYVGLMVTVATYIVFADNTVSR